jgi:general secretion pathway protein J
VKRSEDGFTLLELLVAVVLLATLMVLLANGISLVSHHLDRSIERRDRATTVALVQNYLRAALGQTLPVAVASDTASVIDFTGSSDHMGFVSRAPKSAPLGGMMKFDLRFDPGKRGAAGALIVDWQPYHDIGRDLETDQPRAGTRQLLAGVGGVEFAYYDPGAPDRPSGWRDDWHDLPILPTLVRISVAFRDGEAMPDLIVALRLSSPAPANPTPGTPQKTQ